MWMLKVVVMLIPTSTTVVMLIPTLDGSGEINTDLDGSGDVNPDLDGSGEINTDLDGSGEINTDLEGSGEPLPSTTIDGVDGVEGDAVIPNDGVDETEVAAKKGGKWWLLLIPLLAIPILGAILFGGRKKSDREPAVDNVPNINSPEGGINVPGMPGGGVPPVGANVTGNLGNVAKSSVNATSKMGSAGLAAGGAALAGGAAAAANLAGKKRRTESLSDADLDLDLDESATVAEIPSTPVAEFTSDENDLQLENRRTERIDADLDLAESDFDDLPSDGIATDFNRNSESEIVTEFSADSPDLGNTDLDLDVDEAGFVSEQDSSSALNVDSKIESDSMTTDTREGEEFFGDFVLPEEGKNISVSNDSNAAGGTGIIDGATAVGGAALGGAAAAASGLFNRGRDEVDNANVDAPDLDTNIDVGDRVDGISADVAGSVGEINTPNLDIETDALRSDQDTDLNFNLDGEVSTPELDSSTDINIDGDRRTGIIGGAAAAGAGALGGAAAAASGLFNRGRDEVDNANIDAPDLDTDLNVSDSR